VVGRLISDTLLPKLDRPMLVSLQADKNGITPATRHKAHLLSDFHITDAPFQQPDYSVLLFAVLKRMITLSHSNMLCIHA
jgi:hypothetical protein